MKRTRWTRTTEDFAYESYNRNHEVRFPGVTVPCPPRPAFMATRRG